MRPHDQPAEGSRPSRSTEGLNWVGFLGHRPYRPPDLEPNPHVNKTAFRLGLGSSSCNMSSGEDRSHLGDFMNRILFLSIVASAAAAGALASRVVLIDPAVNLQAATPGVQQVGHINVSGKVVSGALSVANSGSNAQVIVGNATSTTGANYAGLFRTDSSAGTGLRGVASSTSGNANGGTFQTASPAGAGVRGYASSPTGTGYGVYGYAASPSGFAGYFQGPLKVTGTLFGNGSGLTGVNAELLGGVSSAQVVRLQSSPGSAQTGLIRVESNVASPNAVMKLVNTHPTNGSALWCETPGTNGVGVYSINTATTGYAYGGLFRSASPDGRAVFGENTATTGLALGGRFGSASTSARAVYATASADTGGTHGVHGEVFSSEGSGVFGTSNAVGGGYAVYGQSLASVGGYGVFGSTSGFGGFGVYALGKLGASGTKSFRIDHPLDPENKYLLHYAAEGPEPRNVYQGSVVTDASGYAWVMLPDYYVAINRDPLFQLTVVDKSEDFVQAKVIEEVQGNRFRIRTSKANVKVCWRVDAVRNDLWVRKHGAPVEEDKVGAERGTYQHPDLYDLGPERGMSWVPAGDRRQPMPPVSRSARFSRSR